MYSFTNQCQITVLPWSARLYQVCFTFILFQMVISVSLIVGGCSGIVTAGLLILFAFNGSFMLWMFEHGKARIKGERVMMWNWGFSAQIESDECNLETFDSRFVHHEYLRPFMFHLEYLRSLRTLDSAAFGKPEAIRFDGGVLRPWVSQDLIVYRSVFSDAELMRWHDVTTNSRREARMRIAYASTIDTSRSTWAYKLVNSEGRICGHLELRLCGTNGWLGEISFGLLAPYRRCGYMSSALSALITLLYKDGQRRTLIARTRSSNDACLKLLERLGFSAVEPSAFNSMLGRCKSSDMTLAKTYP